MARADTLDAAFTALADPARRQVVRLLAKKPQRSSDLADTLAVSRPAMSKHLRWGELMTSLREHA